VFWLLIQEKGQRNECPDLGTYLCREDIEIALVLLDLSLAMPFIDASHPPAK
jgi:hypothetical protein